jgi:hypothetical protein
MWLHLPKTVALFALRFRACIAAMWGSSLLSVAVSSFYGVSWTQLCLMPMLALADLLGEARVILPPLLPLAPDHDRSPS